MLVHLRPIREWKVNAFYFVLSVLFDIFQLKVELCLERQQALRDNNLCISFCKPSLKNKIVRWTTWWPGLRPRLFCKRFLEMLGIRWKTSKFSHLWLRTVSFCLSFVKMTNRSFCSGSLIEAFARPIFFAEVFSILHLVHKQCPALQYYIHRCYDLELHSYSFNNCNFNCSTVSKIDHQAFQFYSKCLMVTSHMN